MNTKQQSHLKMLVAVLGVLDQFKTLWELTDGVSRQLRECADREGVTVGQLMSSAGAEKLSAMLTMEHLCERARHAKRGDFIAFLNGSPDVPPLPGDEL